MNVPKKVQRKYFSFSFALMQKKQKIKENPIAPHVFPCLRSAKADGYFCREGVVSYKANANKYTFV